MMKDDRAAGRAEGVDRFMERYAPGQCRGPKGKRLVSISLGSVLASVLMLGVSPWSGYARAATYGPSSCDTTPAGTGPDNINHGQAGVPVNGSGNWSNVVGCGADGGGLGAVQVMGPFATATGNAAVTIGYASSASLRGTALGMQAVASGNGATAIGQWTRATGPGSVAIGGDMSTNDANAGAQALGGQAIAVGGLSRAMRNGDIAIGAGAVADGQADNLSALAVGLSARAVGNDAAAFGNNAVANGHFALAVGNFANASGGNAAAVGNSANAAGMWSSAFGNFSNAAGRNAAAIGNSANAAGAWSSAFGNFSRADGESSVALGSQATATNPNDVALGSASRTAAAVATPNATIDGRTYSFAGTAPASTVSVGDANAERTVTNVAAGRISGTSTDAVNGSQLFAANQAIEGVSGRVNTLGSSVATAPGRNDELRSEHGAGDRRLQLRRQQLWLGPERVRSDQSSGPGWRHQIFSRQFDAAGQHGRRCRQRRDRAVRGCPERRRSCRRPWRDDRRGTAGRCRDRRRLANGAGGGDA